MKVKIILAVISLFAFMLPLNAQSLKVVKDTTLKTSSGKVLSLEIYSGDVIISKGNIDEVNVKISGSDELKDNAEFVIISDNDGVNIKSEAKKKNHSGGFNYEITVPSNFNLKVATTGGDIKVTGISGTHKITTSGGDISIADCKGELRSITSGGDINIKSHDGDLKAVTSGGNIIIKTSNGEVEASTSGGDIETEYTGTNKGIKLTTTGGDIKLIIADGFQADLSLSTTGGNVKVDLENITDKIAAKQVIKEK